MPLNGQFLDKSGLTYLWSKLKTKFAAKQDTISDLASIRSGAAAGATAVQPAEFEADQDRQEVEIGAVANTGAKNLFKNEKNAGASVVRQGATWVFDQTSVEANVSGSVSDTWSDVYLLNSSLDLSDKEYKIVIESDSPNIFMYIPGNTLSGGNIPSNGQYYPGVYKYKGIMTTSTRFTAKTASYSNNNIRCMICPASITDSTFVPYAKTNRELTVAEDEDRAALVAQVDGGAKNRLNYNLATFGDKSKVTIDQGGSITGSITSDTRQYNWSNREFEFTLPAGDYVFCINRLAGNNAYTSARLMTAGNTNLCSVAANPNISPSTGSFTLNTDTTVGFMGKIFSDTITVMLCTAADYAISTAFVPYAPTNRELWEKINSIKRTYKVPISSTPVNNLYFGVQMFPFEFNSIPNVTVEVKNVGQGGVIIDPSKFTVQINKWGFRIYTKDSYYAGLIPDVEVK